MERNVKAAIIEAVKVYTQSMGRDPAWVNIDTEAAYDLMKLGRNEIGEMSDRFAREGISAFNECRLWGVEIRHESTFQGIRCE